MTIITKILSDPFKNLGASTKYQLKRRTNRLDGSNEPTDLRTGGQTDGWTDKLSARKHLKILESQKKSVITVKPDYHKNHL